MLSLSNLIKSYPTNFEPTLKALDLQLEQRDFCIVIGSNGSGKSTLLRSIAGEEEIDSGHIAVDGKILSTKERQKIIASVTQDVNKGTIAEMTLLENMVLSLMRGQTGSLSFYQQRLAYIASIVEQLDIGLERSLSTLMGSLSGGQRQMMATLMAIASKPKILLLDEHTSALDPKMQRRLMDYTAASIAKEGMTAMMITHKLDDAALYGNKLIMLHKGKIVFSACGAEKKALSVSQLLSLFHRYEDLTLQSEEP